MTVVKEQSNTDITDKPVSQMKLGELINRPDLIKRAMEEEPTASQIKNIGKQLDLTALHEAFVGSDIPKRIKENLESFQQMMAGLSEKAVGFERGMQTMASFTIPLMTPMKEFQEKLVSVADAEAAFAKALSPKLETMDALKKSLEAYRPDFVKITGIANLAGEHLAQVALIDRKVFTEWQATMAGESTQVAQQLEELRSRFKDIAVEWRHNFDMFPSHDLWIEPVISPITSPLEKRSLHEAYIKALNKIANNATQTMEERIVEKVVQRVSQLLTDQEQARTVALAQAIEPNDLVAPSAQTLFEWDGLVINVAELRMQFREKKSVEITLIQPIQWLICVMAKQGEVAQYVEIALATGLIFDTQGKKNMAVARPVGQIRKKLITFLKEEVGMTAKEIKQMIVNKPKHGYALRKIKATKKPPK